MEFVIASLQLIAMFEDNMDLAGHAVGSLLKQQNFVMIGATCLVGEYKCEKLHSQGDSNNNYLKKNYWILIYWSANKLTIH